MDTSRAPNTSATIVKPWSELVPKPEGSVTIIEDKDELVLTTPASPVSVPAPVAGQPEKPPSPAPADPAPVKEPAKTSLEVPVTSTKPENVDMKPAAPASPSVVAGPAPAKPTAAPQPPLAPVPVPAKPGDTNPPFREDPPIVQKLPPYNIPAPGVPGPVAPPIPPAPPNMKKLEKSRRYWGLAIFHGGRLLMILGATTLPGTFAVTFGHVYGAVVADPALFSAVINALAFTTGLVMDTVGGWLHKRGGNRANSVLVAGNEPPEVVSQK